MKRIGVCLCGLLMLLSLTACGNIKENETVGNSSGVSGTDVSEVTTPTQSSTVSAIPERSSVPSVSTGETSEPSVQSETNPVYSETSSIHSETNPIQTVTSPVSSENPVQTQPPQTDTPSRPTEASQPDNEKEELRYMLNIKIGEDLLTATLEHNSSAEALLKLLSEGPVTVHMSDYAGMEKVGTLPASLPRNDESIDTDACDLILYQGDRFVIYYDTNSWSLTRLGRINNATPSELRKILGAGDVTAVLSLP